MKKWWKKQAKVPIVLKVLQIRLEDNTLVDRCYSIDEEYLIDHGRYLVRSGGWDIDKMGFTELVKVTGFRINIAPEDAK